MQKFVSTTTVYSLITGYGSMSDLITEHLLAPNYLIGFLEIVDSDKVFLHDQSNNLNFSLTLSYAITIFS